MYHGKAKILFKNRYKTRKDWHHQNEQFILSFYRKKPYRKLFARIFRKKTKHMDLGNGGYYKKVQDLKWTIL